MRRWTDEPPAEGESFAAWLRPAQEAWAARVQPAVTQARTTWFGQQRQWVGHSTFVGLALERTGSNQLLRGLAIGDTNVYVVRRGRLLRAFPLERSAEFARQVHAVPSRGELAAGAEWQPRTLELDVQGGDEVFVMSDALAAWTMREIEAGRTPFRVLRAINGEGNLQKFVDRRRGLEPGTNPMEVDDVTLLRFVVPGV